MDPTWYQQFNFQKRHPVLTGLLTFLHAYQYNQIAGHIASVAGTTVMACHLFNGLRLNLQTQTWPDIDALIAAYGEDYLFVGAAPKDLHGCLQRSQLVHGAPLAKLTTPRKGARGKKQPYKVVVRELRTISEAMPTIYTRYSCKLTFDQSRYSTDCIENLLGCPKSAPEKVLTSMRDHPVKHVPTICYGYFSMFERVEALFDQIEAFTDDSRKLTIKGPNGPHSTRDGLVSHIFEFADLQNEGNAGPLRKMKKEGKDITVLPGILDDIADLITPFLRKYGDIEVRRAKALYDPLRHPSVEVSPQEPWLQLGFEMQMTKLEKDTKYYNKRMEEAERAGIDPNIDTTPLTSYTAGKPSPRKCAERRKLMREVSSKK